MSWANRKTFLVTVLLICIALVIADRQGNAQSGAVVGAVVRNPEPGAKPNSGMSSADSPAQAQAPIQPLLARDDYQTLSEKLFSSAVSGQEKEIQAAAPVTIAAPPTAPALPFSVIGKQRKGEAWEVFLAKENQTFVAHEGDMLASVYQVVSIKPPGMQLLYLPLQQTQTLMIGAPFDD